MASTAGTHGVHDILSSLDVGFKKPCILPAPGNGSGELARSQMIHDVVTTKFEFGEIVVFPDISAYESR
jgi:hypothetical protein